MRTCRICHRTASCGCAFDSEGICKICAALSQGEGEKDVPGLTAPPAPFQMSPEIVRSVDFPSTKSRGAAPSLYNMRHMQVLPKTVSILGLALCSLPAAAQAQTSNAPPPPKAPTVTEALTIETTETPESVVERYTKVVQRRDWKAAAALMHPDALRQLKRMFRPIVFAVTAPGLDHKLRISTFNWDYFGVQVTKMRISSRVLRQLGLTGITLKGGSVESLPTRAKRTAFRGETRFFGWP